MLSATIVRAVPRLTNNEYLRRHSVLQELWSDHSIVFGILIPSDQWVLHRYFQTTADLPDAELLAKREGLQEAEPSLPHRAGKVFVIVDAVARFAQEKSEGNIASYNQIVMGRVRSRIVGDHKIKTPAVAKPGPDLAALAFALMQLVTDEMRLETKE